MVQEWADTRPRAVHAHARAFLPPLQSNRVADAPVSSLPQPVQARQPAVAQQQAPARKLAAADTQAAGMWIPAGKPAAGDKQDPVKEPAAVPAVAASFVLEQAAATAAAFAAAELPAVGIEVRQRAAQHIAAEAQPVRAAATAHKAVSSVEHIVQAADILRRLEPQPAQPPVALAQVAMQQSVQAEQERHRKPAELALKDRLAHSRPARSPWLLRRLSQAQSPSDHLAAGRTHHIQAASRDYPRTEHHSDRRLRHGHYIQFHLRHPSVYRRTAQHRYDDQADW